jgi:hypothetical protein
MPTRWKRDFRRLGNPPAPLEEIHERAQEPPGPGSGLPPTRQRVTVVVVAIALFVAVAAVGWRVFRGVGDQAPRVDHPVVSDEAPPPVSASPVSLWLSAERVPPGQVELVALLVNDGAADVMFGVQAKVDRWNGDAWVPAGELVMCMDHWHCTAQIQPPGGSLHVPSIGLGPRPGMPAPSSGSPPMGCDRGGIGSHR